jgi:hypothetical protein
MLVGNESKQWTCGTCGKQLEDVSVGYTCRMCSQLADGKANEFEDEKGVPKKDIRYVVGDLIDCRDNKNKWYESTVKEVKTTEVLIHFNGWASKYDEWIPIESERIAPVHSHSKAALKKSAFAVPKISVLQEVQSIVVAPPQKVIPKVAINHVVGGKIDVLDQMNMWFPATIREVRETEVFVHFDGFPEKWDEWIPIGSDRIAPLNSLSVKEASKVAAGAAPVLNRGGYVVGGLVDCQDRFNKWFESTIVEVKEDSIFVHYNGWPDKWNEWIPINSPRLAPVHTHSIPGNNRGVPAAGAAPVQPNPPQAEPAENIIQQIMAMGFSRDEAVVALRNNGNNTERAVNFLINN